MLLVLRPLNPNTSHVLQETNGFEVVTLLPVESSHHAGTTLAHPGRSRSAMLEQKLAFIAIISTIDKNLLVKMG